MLTMSKNKGKKAKAAEQALVPRDDQRHKTVRNWDDYFKKGELEDWQRLMRDLGFDEEFASKTQCRKVCTHNLHALMCPNRTAQHLDSSMTSFILHQSPDC